MHWVSLLFRTPLQINSLDGRMCSVCSRLDRRTCVRPFSPPPGKKALNDFGFLHSFSWWSHILSSPSKLACKSEGSCDSTGSRCSAVRRDSGSGVRARCSWKPAVTGLGHPLDWTSSFFLVCLWWNGSSIHCLILQCSGSGTLNLKVLVCVIGVP